MVEGWPPADSEPGGQALATIVAGLKDEPGVSGIVSYLDLHDPIFVGDGGGTFVIIGLASTDAPVESLIPELHQKARSLQAQLHSQYPAVNLELTGEIPLNFDIRKASADEVERSESLAIPATLALLFLAFGSIVAALIPLAVGELAIASTLGRTPGYATPLVDTGPESGHHARSGSGHRLCAPHGESFQGGALPGKPRTHCRGDRGTLGGTHAH